MGEREGEYAQEGISITTKQSLSHWNGSKCALGKKRRNENQAREVQVTEWPRVLKMTSCCGCQTYWSQDSFTFLKCLAYMGSINFCHIRNPNVSIQTSKIFMYVKIVTVAVAGGLSCVEGHPVNWMVGCGLDSQSRPIPGLWVRFPFECTWEAADQCFSLSLSQKSINSEKIMTINLSHVHRNNILNEKVNPCSKTRRY